MAVMYCEKCGHNVVVPHNNCKGNIDMPKKISTNSFEIGGGRVIIGHKSHWPDCLHIKMNRHNAWDFVQNVLNQLRDEKRDEIRFGACGKLNTNEDE